jgi:uncharacterized protein
MPGESSDGGLSLLSEDECWRFLQSQHLGRIAIVLNGEPEVFPVNYTVSERTIVFRTGTGMVREHAPKSASCFEADGFASVTGTGWSVVVHGQVREITAARDPASARLREVGVYPAAPGIRQHWMAMPVVRISGRYFTSGPLAPGVVGDG